MGELLELIERNESFKYYFGVVDENEALDSEEFDDDDDTDDDEEVASDNPDDDEDEDEEALNLPDSPRINPDDLPEENKSDE
jgi:hypothetical protein